MKKIKALKLTDDSFADYGYVISQTQEAPIADNAELTYWGKVSQLKMSDVVSTGIMYAHKRLPIIKSLERHIKTPEILAILEGDSVILFGKSSKEGIDEESLKAFYIKQGDAIAMYEGTWHWVGIPVDCDVSKFLVLFACNTEDEDLEVKDLTEEVEIVL